MKVTGFTWNQSRDLSNGLKRCHSEKEKKRIEDCTRFFAELSFKNFHSSSINISISEIKKKFGRRYVSSIMPRFVHILNLGNNLSKKNSIIEFKKLSELNKSDQELITSLQNTYILDIKDIPKQFDFKSKSNITQESISASIIEAERLKYIEYIPFLNSLRSILDMSSSIDIYYQRTYNSKRLYACWPGNLISLPKIIRQKLLNGINIDISNAITDFHISNLQLENHPMFAYYALESDNIKNFLTDVLQIDYSKIKGALHSVHVGGNFAEGQIKLGKSALLDIFENNCEAAINFTEYTAPLLKAFKTARIETVDSYSNKISGSWISTMPLSKEVLKFDRRSQTKMFMAGYFDSEEHNRKILSDLTNNFGLLAHDGIDGILEDNIKCIKHSQLPFKIKIIHPSGHIEYTGKNKNLLSLEEILNNKNLSKSECEFIKTVEKFKEVSTR